nr:serine hydrolase [Phycicoccus endophyticus]
MLVGRYVRDRKLDVSAATVRPEWTDERADITVDQLMRMTSGLRWDETYDLGTPITEMLYAEPDMAGFAASQPLAHQPGTYQQYSSGSTNIVCSWLDAQADVPERDFPRRKLFAPLGLSSAVWEVDASGTPVCSSYLWATPRDWATLGQFALQDGVWNGKRLLPHGWMTRSTTVTKVAQTDADGYAAGWWSNTRADGSRVVRGLPADAYWASGHDGQRLYVVPSQHLVVVRLGFSPRSRPGTCGPTASSTTSSPPPAAGRPQNVGVTVTSASSGTSSKSGMQVTSTGWEPPSVDAVHTVSAPPSKDIEKIRTASSSSVVSSVAVIPSTSRPRLPSARLHPASTETPGSSKPSPTVTTTGSPPSARPEGNEVEVGRAERTSSTAESTPRAMRATTTATATTRATTPTTAATRHPLATPLIPWRGGVAPAGAPGAGTGGVGCGSRTWSVHCCPSHQRSRPSG